MKGDATHGVLPLYPAGDDRGHRGAPHAASASRCCGAYVSFIQQLPQGQAGKLHLAENEKPTTIRRRLVAAAKALDTRLVIKRSGEDLYFWREGGVEKQDRPRRGRRRQRHEETAAPDLPFREPEEVDQEVAEEESPELGQTW